MRNFEDQQDKIKLDNMKLGRMKSAILELESDNAKTKRLSLSEIVDKIRNIIQYEANNRY